LALEQTFAKAVQLIFSFDAELVEIVSLSLKVSGAALGIAVAVGLGLATLLALYRFPGRGLCITLLNTLTGLPPVVVGLTVYILLSRQGPLGFLELLYSPGAMILAQTVLAVPIIAALSHAAVNAAGSAVRTTAICLGATESQAVAAIFKDARYALMAAVATAFGRLMAEVGAVLIVGGNIAHHTRVMTTSIAMETDRGDFELAIVLGLVLLVLSFAVNGLFYAAQRKGIKR
jgi:tungstate transport system permease protein